MANDIRKEYGSVNVIGIAPAYDAFWRGNLHEIERILTQLGLEINVFINYNHQREIESAELNIVLSP